MTLKSYANFEKNTDLQFEKRLEKFVKFFTRALESVKIETLMDPFVQRRMT